MPRPEPCEQCGGEGFANGVQCAACAGDGWIIDEGPDPYDPDESDRVCYCGDPDCNRPFGHFVDEEEV